MMDWRQYFPYDEPREIQAQALDELFRNWDNYDCFVISAPTAFGKTALAKTLMNAFRSVSVITPTNLLVSQFLAEFPDTPTLSRLDTYHCSHWDRPCSVTRGKCLQFCSLKREGIRCPASGDLSEAKYRRGPGIYNYHTYLAHKLYRDVLVVDEAHNLKPTIRDRQSLTIWGHDYRYPHNMWRYDQIGEWVSGLSPQKQKHKKIDLLREAITYDTPRFVVHRTEMEFSGKGTLRGESEMRDCLKLEPVDIRDAPPMFWPSEIGKVILLSATIGPKDVVDLGLGGRRILYIDCKSPIPPANRPIVLLNIVSVNRNNMVESADLVAREIDQIAAYHQGEKGVIHATYQMATLLSTRLTGDRYLFHDRHNKQQQYKLFRESTAESGRILIACGMYEGIDLPEDLGRWQVISKIPWGSLANPAIVHMTEKDPESYLWETIKTTIQACGRICRTPTDFGITYILDKSFRRIVEEGSYMLPEWFTDAIQYTENT